MLIGGVENTSQIRMNPQHVEVVPGRFEAPDWGWIVACVQARQRHGISCQILKTVVAIAQVAIVGI